MVGPGRRARRRGRGISRDGGRGCSPRDSLSLFTAAVASRGGRRAGRGRGPGPRLRPDGRRGLGRSLPRGASQLLLLLSGEAAAPRLPPLPQAGPGGARLGSRGRRVRGQWPSSLRDLPLAWASPLSRHDAASSLEAPGCFSVGEAASTSRVGGALRGEEARAGACVPTHPVAVSFTGIGQRQPFHADVLLSCVCCILPTW